VNPKIIGIYGCEKPPKNGIFIGIDPYPYRIVNGLIEFPIYMISHSIHFNSPLTLMFLPAINLLKVTSGAFPATFDDRMLHVVYLAT
jgi:hypothetical protein